MGQGRGCLWGCERFPGFISETGRLRLFDSITLRQQIECDKEALQAVYHLLLNFHALNQKDLATFGIGFWFETW